MYEFGTTSVSLAIGKKSMVHEMQSDGTMISKHVINIRLVLDERICDGYYFASAVKLFKRYMKHPELLLAPPEYIGSDD